MSAFAHREKDQAWTQQRMGSTDSPSLSDPNEQKTRNRSPSHSDGEEPALISLAYLNLGSDSEDDCKPEAKGSSSNKSKQESTQDESSSSDCEKESLVKLCQVP